MDAVEMMCLINQLRHRALLQEAERERLINASIKKETGSRVFGLNLIAWFKARRVKNGNSVDLPIEVRGSTDPCCLAGDSGS